VYLYVFDVLWADGRDVRPLLLRGLLAFRDPLRFTGHRDTDGEAYWREACVKGWEGIIAKRRAVVRRVILCHRWSARVAAPRW